jgi:hypothetical protein
MSEAFMMAMELMTFRVPEDPASLVSTEGCVMSYVLFYERGFDVSSHQFLCSLL